VIERKNILADSYQQFLTTDGFDFHKEVKIFFVGEVAQDAGGLLREWVTEISKVIFND
jgi:E3 ubiquitin ligase SMURF1/2/E3 ubiquitin-protein ligase NEDD4